MSHTDTPIHQVLIVGAGFSGLGTALRLWQNGIDDIVILERAADIGGTWRDNTYPGAACDIPSNLYSFSFAPNPRWTRSYAGSDEIRDYIHWLADEYDLRRYVRFNRSVTDLSFDGDAGVWTATTEQGETVRARSAVMAQGPLSNPSLPDIPGLERYQGKTIHSADWDHDYDFDGKEVGVIGTGASGVQIVPELAKRAKKLRVFQRTPGWILPRLDFRKPDWQKMVFRKLPTAQSAVRNGLFLAHESMATGIIWDTPVNAVLETLAKAHLRHQVKDKWLRRQLTPDFKLGCKRLLMSSDFYPALQKDNTELITWPIAGISDKGVRTGEGIEHQFDCLVFATGFSVPSSGTPFPVHGLNGRELGQEWRRGAQAYKSINVSGYPNLFMIFGPNSGPGHNSALVYIESQIEYIVKGVMTLRSLGIKALDVKDDVQAKHNRRLQRRLAKTNWNSGCKSWYLTEDGYNATMYPGFASQYARQMKRLELRDYRLLSGAGAPQ